MRGRLFIFICQCFIFSLRIVEKKTGKGKKRNFFVGGGGGGGGGWL